MKSISTVLQQLPRPARALSLQVGPKITNPWFVVLLAYITA